MRFKTIGLPLMATILLMPISGFAHPGNDHEMATFANGVFHTVSGIDHISFYLMLGLLAVLVPAGKRMMVASTGIFAACAGGLIAFAGLNMPLLALSSLLLFVPVLMGKMQGRYLLLVFAGLAISSHSIMHVFISGTTMLTAGFMLGMLLSQIMFVGLGIIMGKGLKNKLHAVVNVKPH